MFLNFFNNEFLRFLVFFFKESLILNALMKEILDKIKQLNGMNPPKVNLFKFFCKLLSHKISFENSLLATLHWKFYSKGDHLPIFNWIN